MSCENMNCLRQSFIPADKDLHRNFVLPPVCRSGVFSRRAAGSAAADCVTLTIAVDSSVDRAHRACRTRPFEQDS